MFYAIDFNAASLYSIEDTVGADAYAPTGTHFSRKFNNAIRAWILRQLLQHAVNASDNVLGQPPQVSLGAMLQMDGESHRILQSLP